MRAFLLIGLLAVASCGPGEPRRVHYKLTGSAATASITIQNDQGGTEQMTVPVPWERSFSATPGSFVYLSAQNQGEAGSITCEIEVDGETLQSSTSTGAYVIAGCSGSVPAA